MVVTVKYLTFVMRADNRGEGGILALLALVPEQAQHGAPLGRIGLVARPRHRRRGAALRRRHHHAGHLACSARSRASRRRAPRAQARRRPAHVRRSSSASSPSSAAARAASARLFGPVMVVWFVDHRRARRRGTSRSTRRSSRRSRRVHGGPLLRRSTARTASASSAPSCSRSPAARRSTPTWATSARSPIRARLARARLPGARPLLLRPGRARPRATPARAAQPVLRHGPARAPRPTPLVALATRRDGHRLAGAHLRRLLAHPPGRCSSATSRASRSSTRRGETEGQIYVPQINWGLARRVHRARPRVPRVDAPRRGVRHRGQRDDGDHLASSSSS